MRLLRNGPVSLVRDEKDKKGIKEAQDRGFVDIGECDANGVPVEPKAKAEK